ncbi:MAG: AfsA-related hotdog domain-containing protein, partial [Actinomycetota bacterium]
MCPYEPSDELELVDPIPSEVVHRSAQSEVFVTSLSRMEEDTFRVSARWPPDHPFYHADAGQSDPMLVAETMRQAGIAVTHLGYAVPSGAQFIMSEVSFLVTDPSALRVGQGETRITVVIRCSEVTYREGVLRRSRFHAEFLRQGDAFARGSGFLVCVPADLYGRMRSRRSSSRPASSPA